MYFMFYYFEPIFIKKFLWESGFSNFGHMTIFTKQKFVFWPPFWNGTFFYFLFLKFFLLLYGYLEYIQT